MLRCCYIKWQAEQADKNLGESGYEYMMEWCVGNVSGEERENADVVEW